MKCLISRGERYLRVAFQTHPGRQASISSGSKEPRSALEQDCSISVLKEACLSTTRKTHWPELLFCNDCLALQLNNQLKTYLLHDTEIYLYLQFLRTLFFFWPCWVFVCQWILLLWTLSVGHTGFSSWSSRLWGTGSAVATLGFSCSVSCGIFMDQELNLYLLH